MQTPTKQQQKTPDISMIHLGWSKDHGELENCPNQ